MCYSAMVKKDLKSLALDFGATIVREQFDQYDALAVAESKSFIGFSQERIFPNNFAPVIYLENCAKWIAPMRYSAFPPAFIPDPRKFTTFNARRDNLTSSFWSDMYGKHHGIIVLKAFYEWVAVKDLLKAGVVSIEEIAAQFAAQSAERKEKILKTGKKYLPTPTERKDPRFRSTIIRFESGREHLVPVIFSQGVHNGFKTHGFALITDDPPPEVMSAGHDRCPIFLTRAASEAWLDPEGKKHDELQNILSQREDITLRHALAA